MTEAKVGCHLWHSEADEGDVREQLVELAEGGNAEPGGVRGSQGREGVQLLLSQSSTFRGVPWFVFESQQASCDVSSVAAA